MAWVFLDRQEQFYQRLIEALAEEMRHAEYAERGADARAWTEAQRGFDMLNCGVVPASPNPNIGAEGPPACEARVEKQRAVNQCHHRADVLAEVRQSKRSVCQAAWVIAGHFQCSPREIDALTANCPWILPQNIQPMTTDCGPSECGSIV